MNWRARELDSPHRKWKGWTLGMRVARDVYPLTDDFSDDERHGLVCQLRRAVVSVPSKIAERSARKTDADHLRFLYRARGSLVEVDTHTELAHPLGSLADAERERLADVSGHLSRGLQGLVDSLEQPTEAAPRNGADARHGESRRTRGVNGTDVSPSQSDRCVKVLSH